MAKVRANQLFFDGLILRNEGDEFDLDPLEHAPSDAIEYLDPEAQRIAEEAHAKRGAARVERSLRAELEAKVREEAEAKLRAQAEAKLKSESSSDTDKV